MVGEADDRRAGAAQGGVGRGELVDLSLHLADARGEDRQVERAVLDGPIQVVEPALRLGELGGDGVHLGAGGCPGGVGLLVDQIDELLDVRGGEQLVA
ncbi:MAG: hypothetical protein H6738_20355 [Alphaproteobacteria bacterium]|nr:hypothetical protein [Alphaproteobacteria bacterium]